MERYTRIDYTIIIALAALALTLALGMAWFVTERIPHLEDEITYLFQARTYARGALWAPPPPDRRAFFTPFVLTLENGRRVGKYAIGWPLVLALGERYGMGWLINPLLGALTTALTYVMGRELADRRTGLVAALLACTSPFFLIQSSTYMSHAAACWWATLFMWAIWRAEAARVDKGGGQRWAALAGFAIGMLALTRSLTALAVLAPFAVFLGLQALRRPVDLLKTYWPLGAVGLSVAALQPLYLYVVTGSPTTNLYTMVWPYDRLGFGPGTGPHEGHTLRQALFTAKQDLSLWTSELFGWRYTSWVPLLPGLLSSWRRAGPGRRAWPFLLLGPFVALVIVHLAYWVGAKVYGPRYYYEGHVGLSILAALGLQEMIRAAVSLIKRLRRGPGEPSISPVLLYGTLGTLIALNGLTYLPERIDYWHGLYTISREPLDRLEQLRQTDCVLVMVRGRHWVDYGAFFYLNSPWLDGPIIAAHDNDLNHTFALMALFPDREVWFYKDGEFSQEPFPYDDS